MDIYTKIFLTNIVIYIVCMGALTYIYRNKKSVPNFILHYVKIYTNITTVSIILIMLIAIWQ